MENTTSIESVRDLTMTALEPLFADNGATPYTVIPDGHRIHDLTSTLAKPLSKRGITTLRDPASLIAFAKEEGDADLSRIYFRLQPPKVVVVFDDTKDGPSWLEHRAEYECPLSVEWKTWTAANKKTMTQADFAQFIEDNAPDIVDPPSADMIEISRSLEAKKKANFASGIRLQNGATEFTYEESIEGTAAKGKLVVPETFRIGIPVLENGDRFGVTARLRYRIGDGGKLAMWYDLERPHKVLELAVSEVFQKIAAETGLAMFNGEPPAPGR